MKRIRAFLFRLVVAVLYYVSTPHYGWATCWAAAKPKDSG